MVVCGVGYCVGSGVLRFGVADFTVDGFDLVVRVCGGLLDFRRWFVL